MWRRPRRQHPNHREVSPAYRTTVELIDRLASYIGRATAWLIIPMTIAVTWEVVARHFFRAPTIWAFDVVYMMYGTHFMLGTAYTLMRSGTCEPTCSIRAGPCAARTGSTRSGTSSSSSRR